MSFPRYREYRDSRVAWLGSVPAHWVAKPLKHVADFVNGCAFKPTDWGDTGIPIIRIQNLNGGDDFNRYDGEVEERYLVRDGDLLFGWSGNRGTSFGPFLWRHSEVCALNQHIFRVEPHGMDKLPLYWTLKAVTAHVEDQAHGIIGMVHVTKGDLGAIQVPVPPALEQRAIAEFLDSETAKIDALIAEQQRLMELLQEKRQAVISHAVTKGLNPDAPMKPSGVEWLGDVPAHWSVSPLKWLTDPGRPIMYGIVLPGPDVREGIPILKGGNVKPHRMNLTSMARTTAEIEAPYARARLRTGDLVYAIRGTIGDCEIVPNELEHSNITQDVARIAATADVSNEWLRWTLLSSPVREELACGSLGAAVRGVNIYDLKRVRVPVPPASEQQQIAEYVRAATARFDALREAAVHATEILAERRAALISAAVTGQIDVRVLESAEAA